jgi:purine-binding chemotaxis protein CheW
VSEIQQEVSTDTGRQIATFRVGEMIFGIDVMMVQEVIRFQRMTVVPLAPPAVKGLINLRGQILTAIDLRELLGMEPRGEDERPMNVVFKSGQDEMSLLVDKIDDVLELDPRRLEPTPETLDEEYKNLVGSVYKLDQGLLLILSPDKVSRFSEDL